MVEVWSYITQFFRGLADFWNWLLTPIDVLGGWQPITIIGITGFGVIVAFWLIKLVNPLS